MQESGTTHGLDALPAAAAEIDREGNLAAVNDRWLRVFAAEREDVVGSSFDRWFPEQRDVLAAVADGGARVHGRRLNGVPFIADIAVAPCDGVLLCLLHEVRGPGLLSAAQRYLDVAFESAPLAMALCNTDGEYVRVNAAMCQMLCTTADRLVGRRDQEFTHPDDRAQDVEVAWRILNGELDVWQTEKRFVAVDGRVVWAIASLAFVRDEAGRPVCWFAQFQDITARKRAESELRYQAEHDPLTGLANRRRLVAELERRIAMADCGALILLDLNGFKKVNDSLGHAVGDAVLVDVGRALEANVRDADLVARLGGDEFAVVLPGACERQAAAIASELANAVSGVRRGAVAVSHGIARYGPEDARSPRELIELADAAMYAAKRAQAPA